MDKIKLLDCFAWIGGFHLALEQSIWANEVSCIGFSEIDSKANMGLAVGPRTRLDVRIVNDAGTDPVAILDNNSSAANITKNILQIKIDPSKFLLIKFAINDNL